MRTYSIYLKVPQKREATKTPGIPCNLPSTSITKYGKIYRQIIIKKIILLTYTTCNNKNNNIEYKTTSVAIANYAYRLVKIWF